MALKLNQWQYAAGSENGKVLPEEDARLYNELKRQNVLFAPPAVSQVGANGIHVDDFSGLVYGRYFSESEETLTINLTGTPQYGLLCIAIDLLNSDTPISWVQLTGDATPTPTQDNLFSGNLFQIPIATYAVNETSISNVVAFDDGGNYGLMLNEGETAGNYAHATMSGTTLNIVSDIAPIGENYSVVFNAPEAFEPTINDATIDGAPVTLKGLDGEAIDAGWAQNVPIVLTRRGGSAFFKQGGAGLNFKILGSPTRPQAAGENTIWVNTSDAMNGYTAGTTEPTGVNGSVWIKTNAQSAGVVLNALKSPVIGQDGGEDVYKQGMTLYPSAAYQMTAGVWEQREAWIYQNGAWLQLVDTKVLYGVAGESVPFTGVTRGSAGTGFGASDGGIYLTVYAAQNAEAAAVTLTPVDVTRYNFLHATASAIGYTQFNAFGIRNDQGPFNTTSGWVGYNRWSSPGTMTVDLRGVTGSYYIAVSNWNNGNLGQNTMTVTNIWLGM